MRLVFKARSISRNCASITFLGIEEGQADNSQFLELSFWKLFESKIFTSARS